MYKGLRVSVVMPAYNETEGIADTVKQFLSLPEVDEVLVADNNSKDGTGDVARGVGAKVITETRQGYGFACRKALAGRNTVDGALDCEDLRLYGAPLRALAAPRTGIIAVLS